MAISADTYGESEPVRRPGDFARHPETGAPYVAHPTETTKHSGNKADLVALCVERGIAVPAGAKVADLHELLGPRPKRVQYGRPSSLGKQIENMTNIQKWSERAVALGCFLAPELLNDLAELDPSQLTLDDAAARELLDSIAVRGKSVAQAGLAADRGTHTHAATEDHDEERDWIERATAGEDLGLPVEVQRALVEAWRKMLAVRGIEIVAVEALCVDDLWRQAGTLDRICRLTRALTFRTVHGEIVTLPAGWVGILDIKTGRLRLDRAGHVSYWQGYAVQLASYAQSLPYDPTTDTRGEWEHPIDQQWAIIAHLDVLSALDGNARCRLVLVDLAAGREAGERCVWARSWEKRIDVFSAIDDSLMVEVPVAAGAGGVAPLPADEPPWPASGTLVGLRTNCFTDETTEVELRFETRQDLSGEWWLHLLDGPTGYESAPLPAIVDDLLADPDNVGWSACAGTPRRWDRLLVTRDSIVATIAATSDSAPEVEQHAGEDTGPPAPSSSPAPTDPVAFAMLAEATKNWPDDVRARMAAIWPTGVPTPGAVRRGEAVWTDEHLPSIQAAFDAAGAPFNVVTEPVAEPTPRATSPVDAVEPPQMATDAEIDAFVTSITGDRVRAQLNAWLAEGKAAGTIWQPRVTHLARHLEIARAAHHLAVLFAGDDDQDDYVRAVLRAAGLGDAAEFPAIPIGAVLAALTADEARLVQRLCTAVADGNPVHLTFSGDGHPVIAGDIAALAA